MTNLLISSNVHYVHFGRDNGSCSSSRCYKYYFCISNGYQQQQQKKNKIAK